MKQIIFLCLLLASTFSYASGTIKIWVLGDSISQGRNFPDPPANPDVDSWRREFWFNLQNNGYINTDMVGTFDRAFNGLVPPDGATPLSDDYDWDHDARWGWKLSTYIESDKVPAWAATLAGQGDTPDIAIVHLGTNDSADAGTVILANMLTLVGQLRDLNPNIKILIAEPGAYWNNIKDYADLLPQFAIDNSTKKSPIKSVDLHTGWIADDAAPGTHTMDWVHPNTLGEKFIADRFFEAVESYLIALNKSEKEEAGCSFSVNGSTPGILGYLFYTLSILILMRKSKHTI